MYEPLYGKYPECSAECETCGYFIEDPVCKIMRDWKEDAGVTTPILWKREPKRNKVCLYTTHPGYFIGKNGERYKRFHKLLQEATDDQYFKNGIDIIECEDYV